MVHLRSSFWIILLLVDFLTASGQLSPDRHSLVKKDQWLSCTASPNPNALRPNSHWIMYDLGFDYSLGKTKFWNYNQPLELNNGIQNITIDLSEDGVTWTEAANFIMEQSNGSGFYEGMEGPNLLGTHAKYILLTGLSNYGGTCYGLGEFKVEILSSPLAVHFVKIYTDCDANDKPKILWNVANEENILKYEITSSKDGIIWDKLDEINPKTAISSSKSYDFTDKSYSGGLLYYKVTSVDQNGVTNVSPIVSNKCIDNLITYDFSPNPVTSILNFKISVKNSISINLKVIDEMGRIVLNTKQNIESSDVIKIDVSSLSAGIYTITFAIDGVNYSSKIVKID